MQRFIRGTSEMRNGKLPTIKLKDNQLADIEKILDQVNKPNYANRKALNFMFANFEMHGLKSAVSKSENDYEKKTAIFRNQVNFLHGKVYECVLPDLQEYILSACVFFPAISEILKAHDLCYNRYSWEREKLRIICQQSLEYHHRSQGRVLDLTKQG